MLGWHVMAERLIIPGLLSLLAKCEKRGRLKLFRIPVVGKWISSKAYYLRKTLSVPGSERQLQPSEAARQAAIRRQVQLQYCL